MKEYLSRKNIPFVEKNVAVDRAAAIEMVRRSGQMGVPVIAVGDQVIVGFDVRALDRLLARARATPPPSLGLKVADASRMAARGGETVPRSGAYVGVVNPGGVGERAGLQVGDVIISISGQEISSADDVARVMASLHKEERSEIVFIRRNQTMRVVVDL